MQRSVMRAVLLSALLYLFLWALLERNKNIANIVKCGPNWKVEGCDK